MKISIIVPTYKPQAYLWECLDSIYNQTFPKADYELVLVLNGCNEPYNTQIAEWLLNHDDLNVTYIQTNEGGVSNARNIALDKAKGKHITFIDDDDYVSPQYLERLYEKTTPDIISLCYPYAFNDGEPEKQLAYPMTEVYEKCNTDKKYTLSSKAKKFLSGPCMKLIPMNFIQERRFDVRFKNGEDSLFMFLISDCMNYFKFADSSAVYFRRYRAGSALRRKKNTSEIILNTLRMIGVYNGIYIRHPFKYKFSFFITRVLGAIHGAIEQFKI